MLNYAKLSFRMLLSEIGNLYDACTEYSPSQVDLLWETIIACRFNQTIGLGLDNGSWRRLQFTPFDESGQLPTSLVFDDYSSLLPRYDVFSAAVFRRYKLFTSWLFYNIAVKNRI
jgi:hypothetical protein